MGIRVTNVEPGYIIVEDANGDLIAQVIKDDDIGPFWYIQIQGEPDIEPKTFDTHDEAIDYLRNL